MSESRDARVLVLASEPGRFVEPILARLPSLAIEVCDGYEALGAALDRVRPEAVLAGRIGPAPFPRERILGAPSVAWIQSASAGVDHWMPCGDRVLLTCARGVHDEVLSDYVLCATLSKNLHFAAFRREQERRVWNPRELTSARGQTIVVLGYGSIGRAVANKARALGMTAVGVRRSPGGEASVVGLDALESVVRDADVLAVTLPRTERTLGLVGRTLLSRMKTGSLLVNISRGGIVDEGALLEALDSGPLEGAVLDVFDTEPLPAEHPLWSRDDVLVTPHTGDAAGWETSVAHLFCDNFERWVRGEPLRHRVDPALGY